MFSNKDGEIATMLTVIAVVSILTGLVLGRANLSSPKTLPNQAQTNEPCRIRLVAQITDAQGHKLPISDPSQWQYSAANSIGVEVSPSIFKDGFRSSYLIEDGRKGIGPFTLGQAIHWYLDAFDKKYVPVGNNIRTCKYDDSDDPESCTPIPGVTKDMIATTPPFETTHDTPLSCESKIIVGWWFAQADKITQSPTEKPTCHYNAFANVHYKVGDVHYPLTREKNGGKTLSIVNNKGQQSDLDDTSAQYQSLFRDFNFGPYKKPEDVAWVALKGLDTDKWRVKNIFCTDQNIESPREDGCKLGIKAEGDKLKIENFLVACNVDIAYGWIVEPTDNTIPTPSIAAPTVRQTGIPMPLPTGVEPNPTNIMLPPLTTPTTTPTPTLPYQQRFHATVGQCEASFEQVRDPYIERITIGPVGQAPLFSLDATTSRITGDLTLPFYLAFKNHRVQVNYDPRRQADVAVTVHNPATHHGMYDRQGLVAGTGADPMEVTLYYFYRTGTGRNIVVKRFKQSSVTRGGCEPRPSTTPTVTPTATPTITPSPTITPTPTTAACIVGRSCRINTDCGPGGWCVNNQFCRCECVPGGSCRRDSDCGQGGICHAYEFCQCPNTTTTPTPTLTNEVTCNDCLARGLPYICMGDVFPPRTPPQCRPANPTPHPLNNCYLCATLTPTLTPTPSIQTIRCDTTIEHGIGAPGTYDLMVDLGTTTGIVDLKYESLTIPDRFRATFDGREVVNTGYRSSKYPDTARRAYWDGRLATVGEPPLAGGGSDPETAYFTKKSATQYAYIHVDSPLDRVEWTLRVGCPQPLPVLQCGQEFVYNGQKGTHSFPVELGSGVGRVGLYYYADKIPDRFTFTHNASVIDTGYVSDMYNNPDAQDEWNRRLAALVPTRSPLAGVGSGNLYLNKTSTASMGTLTVDTPFDGDHWNVEVLCQELRAATPTQLDLHNEPSGDGFLTRADQNGDGVINTQDFAILINGFKQLNKTDKLCSARAQKYDIDGDTCLNVLDLSLVIKHL